MASSPIVSWLFTNCWLTNWPLDMEARTHWNQGRLMWMGGGRAKKQGMFLTRLVWMATRPVDLCPCLPNLEVYIDTLIGFTYVYHLDSILSTTPGSLKATSLETSPTERMVGRTFILKTPPSEEELRSLQMPGTSPLVNLHQHSPSNSLQHSISTEIVFF